MAKPRFGGSFAPPLTTEKLAEYRVVAETANEQVREVILKLCDMVELFYQTPESTRAGSEHPSGVGNVVPLEDKEIKRIWDAVPWSYECDAYQQLFDNIPVSKRDLRNTAFHLLWYAKELTQDREPITADKIK